MSYTQMITCIVSYINFKGNHNKLKIYNKSREIVSYIDFRGNHNGINASATRRCIVSYINTKGNHNLMASI